VRVGFVGLGDQGAPMAQAIARAGWQLHVWARRPASVEAISNDPHTVEATIEDLGRSCEIVGLCLGTDNDVEEILLRGGLLKAMGPGGVVAVHSTGMPSKAQTFEEQGRKFGVRVLDAPVSGGREAALSQTLAVMVGGDIAAYRSCLPVFSSFSRLVRHLGPAGSGQMAKLVNNALFTATIKNTAGAFELAEQLGFGLHEFIKVLEASSGNSFAVKALTRLMPQEMVTHVQGLLKKDVDALATALQEMGHPPSPLDVASRSGVADIPSAVSRVLR
jgi:3-hydroxyisobutyrate dehydrogenase-like beta-hydroxyacid dehydrogenase